MKKYIDLRTLPIAYLTPEGDLLLDDEMANYYTSHEFKQEEVVVLPTWDAEKVIFLITGERGGRLPDKQNDPQGLREQLREAIRKAVDAPPLVFPEALDRRFTRITKEKGIEAAMGDLLGILEDLETDPEEREADYIEENLDEEGRWTGPLMFADMQDDVVELCLPGVVKETNEMAVGIDWWGNNPACQILCYENNPENTEQAPAVSVRYDSNGRVVEVSIRDPRVVRLVVEKDFPALRTRTDSPWKEARDADPVDPEKSIIA